MRSRLAAQVLRGIMRTWGLGEADVRPTSEGFDWTPGRATLRVAVRDGLLAMQGCRVSVSTTALVRAPLAEAGFRREVAGRMLVPAATYAPVYCPEGWEHTRPAGWGRRLDLVSIAYVLAESRDWLPPTFALLALAQAVDAAALAGGARDGAVAAAEGLLTAGAQQRSRWIGGPDFEDFAREFGNSEGCFAIGSASGLTAEVPFGQLTALVRLRSDEAHPQLGHGLLTSCRIPLEGPAERLERAAAVLNWREAREWTGFPQLGCWHVQRHGAGRCRLVHSGFVPNAVFAGGEPGPLAVWACARAGWARRQLCPDWSDLPISEILARRFGEIGPGPEDEHGETLPIDAADIAPGRHTLH